MRTVPSLSESQLDQLSEEELFRYMVRVRDAGQNTDFRCALAILVFRHEDLIRSRLRVRLQPAEYDIHLEDMVGNVIARALQAAFDGGHFAQFHSLLHTITHYCYVDFVRRQQRLRVDTVGGHGPDGDDSGMAGPEVAVDGGFDEVELRDLLESVMPANETHRRIIRLSLFDGLPAAEVAEIINAGSDNGTGVTENNVHQIISRYRREARKRYGESV